MQESIDFAGRRTGTTGAEAMRVLTRLVAAAWIFAGCRGEAPRLPETADEPDAAVVEEPEAPVPVPVRTVETGESVKTIERSVTTHETTLEMRSLPLPTPPRTCCRVCRSGQACGNTCIAASRTCHAPPGCACDE